jgi:hypothetical protein
MAINSALLKAFAPLAASRSRGSSLAGWSLSRMDSLMQNGLTANQTKHTKNHASFFWTNPFARRKVKI